MWRERIGGARAAAPAAHFPVAPPSDLAEHRELQFEAKLCASEPPFFASLASPRLTPARSRSKSPSSTLAPLAVAKF
jgi:hypothetical protein